MDSAAYFARAISYASKMFYEIEHRCQCYRDILSLSLKVWTNKLERFVTVKHFYNCQILCVEALCFRKIS